MRENIYLRIFEELLDDNFQSKIELFDELNIADKPISSKNELRQKLNISTFLLEKYLLQLNQDVFSVFGTYLFEQDHHFVKLSSNRNCNKKELLRYYLKKSIKINLLHHLFLKKFTIVSFSMCFFISQSKVYKELQILKTTLKYIEVNISTGFSITGPLETLEMLMMDIYIIFDDKEVTSYRQDLMRILKKNYDVVVSTTFIYHCEVYLNVANYRSYNGYDITCLDYYKVNEESKLNDEIEELIRKHYPRLNAKDLLIIKKNIIIYFENHFNFSIENVRDESVLNEGKLFLNYLKRKDLDLKEEVFQQLKEDTIKYFCLSKNILNDKRDIIAREEFIFFKKYYPAHYQIIEDFVQVYDGTEMLFNSCYALEKMLISLIENVNLYEILPKYYICVDVRGSQSYNKAIKRYLTMHLLFPVEVSWSLTEGTQLIITDHPELYRDKLETIIWNEPINSSQFKELTDKINDWVYLNVHKS